jgi:hypothetical protein
VQTPEDGEPAIHLLQGLGFEQVDRGRVYRRAVEG